MINVFPIQSPVRCFEIRFSTKMTLESFLKNYEDVPIFFPQFLTIFFYEKIRTAFIRFAGHWNEKFLNEERLKNEKKKLRWKLKCYTIPFGSLGTKSRVLDLERSPSPVPSIQMYLAWTILSGWGKSMYRSRRVLSSAAFGESFNMVLDMVVVLKIQKN